MYSRYVELRNQKGVSDYEVSKQTGIPASTFTDWKTGRSKPKVEKIVKLAEFFNCKIDDLIGGAQEN